MCSAVVLFSCEAAAGLLNWEAPAGRDVPVNADMWLKLLEGWLGDVQLRVPLAQHATFEDGIIYQVC